MTDKERLAEVQKFANWDTQYVGPRNIKWLIEQAEKVQQLEKDLHKAKSKMGGMKKRMARMKWERAGAYNHVNRVENDNRSKTTVLERFREKNHHLREVLEEINELLKKQPSNHVLTLTCQLITKKLEETK